MCGCALLLDTNSHLLLCQNDPGDEVDFNTKWFEFGIVPFMFLDCGESTEYAMTFKDDKIVFAFRGTDDSEDWSDNLDYEFTDYAPPIMVHVPVEQKKTGDHDFIDVAGRVHGGFYSKLFGNEYLMNVTAEVFSTLPGFSKEGYEIYVIGHSQGAAMATLYGAWMAQAQLMPFINITVLGFGSPRVGDDDFAESVRETLTNLRVFRVVYEEDAVPRAPFLSMGFQDVGHLLYKSETDEHMIKAYYLQKGGDDYAGVSDHEWDIDFEILDPMDSIHDHSTLEYRGAIAAAVANTEYWPLEFQTADDTTKTPPPQCCWQIFGLCLRQC